MTENTSRLSTALADRYKIERRLGEGGMATVYLAEDLKHQRKVAVKVLRPELAAVLGGERFVQEITTTANLQHPHILPLFDSGEADGFLYYVMPFIDGETLRDRLDRETQLGVEEALRIAAEVADALDYAHRQGVIHRDIKPENILLHDGRPMVADFGIALAVSAAAGGRMTETGLSLGTPHYMSPEQATAEKEITNRSDIYSIGSVLYEMLTGEPPHMGNSAQAIIMKIVTEDAQPVTKLRKTVPANVAAAVARSLEKLPADRFETAKDFATALGDQSFALAHTTETVSAGDATQTAPIRRWLFGTLALNGVLLAALAFSWLRPAPVAPTSRQHVVLWNNQSLSIMTAQAYATGNQAAISPDGSIIVFSDSAPGQPHLFRKLRSEAEPALMPNTEGGIAPFFSPDGNWIAFQTLDGRLRKTPSSGGGAITLAEDANNLYSAGTWLDDGTIVYVGSESRLRRIQAEGGTSEVLPMPGLGFRADPALVSPLPGSRGVLFTTCPGNCANGSQLFVYDLVADTVRLIADDAAGGWYAHGYLLYTQRGGGLFGGGFDLDRLEMTSGAVPVIDGVSEGTLAVSPSGLALYTLKAGDATGSELVWVSRDGSEQQVDPEWQGAFEYPTINTDGSTIAVSLRDAQTRLWVRRANGTRQLMSQNDNVNWRPFWSPDGTTLSFVSMTPQTNSGGAYAIPLDGSAPESPILSYERPIWEAEYSKDGAWIVFRTDGDQTEWNILGRRANSDSVVAFVSDGSHNSQIAFSPDGSWMAFTSDKSGNSEIYVTAFPAMTPRYQVSQGNGTEPRWARSGRELFFKSDGMLMTVSVTAGPSALRLGAPNPLFSVGGYKDAINRQQYDVGPEDRRFLMIKVPEQQMSEDVIYVENFFQELDERLGRSD